MRKLLNDDFRACRSHCELRNATPLKLALGVPTDEEIVKGWRSAQVMTIMDVSNNRIIHGQDQASSPERWKTPPIKCPAGAVVVNSGDSQSVGAVSLNGVARGAVK